MDKNRFIKSELTLEDIRPYISNISGLFDVPFGNNGFLLSNEEIDKSREEYECRFTSIAAMILGVSNEEAKNKILKEKDASRYWCWAHNINYYINIKEEKEIPIFFYISPADVCMYIGGRYGNKMHTFYLDENGSIYRIKDFEKKMPISSMKDIISIIGNFEREDLNKQLKKAKESEKKAEKRLATIKKEIKDIEKRLNKIVKL